MPRLKMQLSPDLGPNLVEIDGQDITKHIYGVSVSRFAKDAIGTVTFYVQAQEIEWEGDISEIVVERVGPTPYEAMRQMLEGVDPAELEAEAMARLGGLEGGPATPAEAFVQVLRDWMRQDGG